MDITKEFVQQLKNNGFTISIAEVGTRGVLVEILKKHRIGNLLLKEEIFTDMEDMKAHYKLRPSKEAIETYYHPYIEDKVLHKLKKDTKADICIVVGQQKVSNYAKPTTSEHLCSFAWFANGWFHLDSAVVVNDINTKQPYMDLEQSYSKYIINEILKVISKEGYKPKAKRGII